MILNNTQSKGSLDEKTTQFCMDSDSVVGDAP